MKAFFALVLFLMGFTITHAQFRKIPAVVTDALMDKYPNARQIEWRDKISVFKSSFFVGKVKMSADFTTKGEWQQTEVFISEEFLPDAVKDGFEKSRYGDREIIEITKIELPENLFRFRLLIRKNDFEKKNLFFDKKGKLIREIPAI